MYICICTFSDFSHVLYYCFNLLIFISIIRGYSDTLYVKLPIGQRHSLQLKVIIEINILLLLLLLFYFRVDTKIESVQAQES